MVSDLMNMVSEQEDGMAEETRNASFHVNGRFMIRDRGSVM